MRVQENVICHLFPEEEKLKTYPRARSCCAPNESTSYVCSSASLALPVALLGLASGGFSSLHPSTYPGTILDSFSISDSIINKALRQLSIICLCVVTFMLGVFLRNQALKTPLTLLIWSVFLLENIHQSIKNSANFPLSFFSCLLHSEVPFSMLGATADSIATFPVIHPSNLRIFCFVFSYASESWSCICCNISKIQALLSAALLKLVPIISSPATHPAHVQPSSQHHLPDAPLRLTQSTAASSATL